MKFKIKSKKVEVGVIKDDDGINLVVAEKEGFLWYVCSLNKEGKLKLFADVPSELFTTSKSGHIKTDKEA